MCECVCGALVANFDVMQSVILSPSNHFLYIGSVAERPPSDHPVCTSAHQDHCLGTMPPWQKLLLALNIHSLFL